MYIYNICICMYMYIYIYVCIYILYVYVCIYIYIILLNPGWLRTGCPLMISHDRVSHIIPDSSEELDSHG